MADVRISAKSTLSTLNRWIEVISGNLVGSQIIGYKGTRMTNKEAAMKLLTTFIRMGVIKRPMDFPVYQ